MSPRVKKKAKKKAHQATAKHGNAKYEDPVDKSIRMERRQWEELESFCPPSAVRYMSWNQKMQILLDLARKEYNSRR